MKVLSPSSTSFVVITSDQDYRHHFQSLRNSGYSIIVIHKALSSNWINIMELHSTEAYHWNDIMMTTPTIPTTTITTSSSSTTTISTISDKKKVKKKHKSTNKNEQLNQEVTSIETNEITHPETSSMNESSTNETLIETPTDWLEGVCTRWKAAYGFCRSI